MAGHKQTIAEYDRIKADRRCEGEINALAQENFEIVWNMGIEPDWDALFQEALRAYRSRNE